MMLMLNFSSGDAAINPHGGTDVSTYLLAGGLSLLIVSWAALRYWLAISKKARHDEISTPTIDRLNVQALSQITDQNQLPLEAVDEPAPDDLLAAVPQDAHLQNSSVAPRPGPTNPEPVRK
ncbi:MAG: hypothetical protein HKL95_03240 [Phycisphaerae bacterium]|nr:hypothetical protein [Phycisphaerae bacterium]